MEAGVDVCSCLAAPFGQRAQQHGALTDLPSDPASRRAGSVRRRPLWSLSAQHWMTLQVTPLHAGQGGATQAAQAAAWQRYLAWERSNVQHLDGPALAARVVLAFDQALGPLVHFPEARLAHRAMPLALTRAPLRVFMPRTAVARLPGLPVSLLLLLPAAWRARGCSAVCSHEELWFKCRCMVSSALSCPPRSCGSNADAWQAVH